VQVLRLHPQPKKEVGSVVSRSGEKAPIAVTLDWFCSDNLQNPR